uniref:TAR DNA-binding protein 43 n=1 Tax=Cacopsylla melanoneura TaxID=428564 RepID=A0A8D9AWG9_9HEMI
MISYVVVQEDENNNEPIELPTEEDGTLLLSTVTAQYPGAIGLKFKTDSGTTRGLRLVDGALHPPTTGWDNVTYLCVFPKENKRKSDDQLENSFAKTKRIETKLKCTDLIILGLPWKSTEDELRKYFQQFGEILMLQVKKDNSGQSRGYGFVRFEDYESQAKVLAQRHMIDGRWCDVKIPNSKEGVLPTSPCKVFVGRVTEDITADDLKDYFKSFGEVTDVFIPKPYRAFAFVTFCDPQVALNLCGEDHIIKGVSVNISEASPKNDNKQSNDNRNGAGSYEGGSSNKRGYFINR